MSYCEKKGKDEIIVVTREDHQKPISGKVAALSAALEKDDDDDEPGFLLPDGKLNWNCPCVGSMVAGPCGYYFREAFTCFHYSKEESKGSDCLDQFKAMHDCMSKYPTVYGGINRETDEDEESVFDKLDSPPQNELSVQRTTDASPVEK